MAAEQEIRNMSEDNIFDALMEQYGKAAGESISAMLKTKVEIKAPEKSETLVKDVEYSILEPAFVCQKLPHFECSRKHCHDFQAAGYTGFPEQADGKRRPAGSGF